MRLYLIFLALCAGAITAREQVDSVSAKPKLAKRDLSYNGCGSAGIIIDKGLTQVGERALIHCCNEHDICYGACLDGGQRECDDQFSACLTQECNQMTSVRRAMCTWDKNGMVLAVRTFGHEFYCTK